MFVAARGQHGAMFMRVGFPVEGEGGVRESRRDVNVRREFVVNAGLQNYLDISATFN